LKVLLTDLLWEKNIVTWLISQDNKSKQTRHWILDCTCSNRAHVSQCLLLDALMSVALNSVRLLSASCCWNKIVCCQEKKGKKLPLAETISIHDGFPSKGIRVPSKPQAQWTGFRRRPRGHATRPSVQRPADAPLLHTAPRVGVCSLREK
jgi:hypothetical protein